MFVIFDFNLLRMDCRASVDLVRVEFPELSHGDHVGEDTDFLLRHRVSLLNLRESSGLINGEVIPSSEVVEMEQTVVL